jgi:CHASE2 domain-containing sensor protein
VLVAVLALTAGAVVHFSGALGGIEHASVSARFKLREQPRPDGVVVVAVDDATFDDLQLRWPFPRSLHARAIDRLRAAGAKVIAYDVQFTEPTSPREDMALYRSIDRAGGAILATGQSDGNGHTNVLGGDDNLARVNSRAAATNLVNEADGAITKFPRSVAGVPSFPVAVAERATGRKLAQEGFDDGEAWIDYRGGAGTFPTLSFSSVVHGKFDPRLVRGKVVVIGATSPSLQDLHPTPVGGRDLMSGPEVEANAIWTALHGVPLRDAPLRLDLVALLLLALAPLVIRMRLGVMASVAVSLAGGAGFLVVAQAAFGSGVVLDVVSPLAALAVATVGLVIASYLAESRERRRIAADNALLERDVRLRTEELEDTQLDVVRRLAAAVEARDAETGSHVDRIGSLSERLALAVGIAPEDAEMIRHAAALHDMGKIAIPDGVLLKPGKLDAGEWELMKTHTSAGAELLAGSRSPLLQLGEVIARTHHERWDGNGYPAGLKGEEIPLSGRICAICDTFDAMISKRPYKEASTREEALAELRRCAATQFDPRLVEVFVALIEADEAAANDAGLAQWNVGPETVVRDERGAGRSG